MIGARPQSFLLVIRDHCSSSRAFHHGDEIVEEVARVVRAGRRLGMILDAEKRERAVAHALVGVIVQIYVRDLDIARRQGIRIDAEAVVLRGNFHFLRQQVFHRMVRAVVAKLQFEGAAAEREAAELMPQANSEDRDAPKQFANVFDGVNERARDRRGHSKGKRRAGFSARTSAAEVCAGTTVTSQP